MEDIVILGIESSCDDTSAAVIKNGELLSNVTASQAVHESYGGVVPELASRAHEKNIVPVVDQALKKAGVAKEQLSAVAFTRGPGLMGSLLVGVSFAKGLCYGVNIPLVAVGSLDSLTEVAREDYEAGILDIENWNEATLCPMIDARRMEVYTQLFNAEGAAQSEVEAKIIDEESFSAERNGKPFVIFGSGAKKCADVLEGATFIEVVPSARGMARLAERAFAEGKTEDVAYFEPFYLKEFVATVSKKKLL